MKKAHRTVWMILVAIVAIIGSSCNKDKSVDINPENNFSYKIGNKK